MAAAHAQKLLSFVLRVLCGLGYGAGFKREKEKCVYRVCLARTAHLLTSNHGVCIAQAIAVDSYMRACLRRACAYVLRRLKVFGKSSLLR